MKHFSIVTIFSCSILILCIACKKGEQGPQGEQGVQGADGSKILSGNGPAPVDVGAIGDFYLDLSASALYGPKTTNGWGKPIILTGSTGAAGSKILSGNGVPAASLGSDGDYYIDKTTNDLYDPKTAGTWGTALSLRGLPGPAGTANVIYSTWKYATNFNDTIIDNSKMKVGYVAAPGLSTTIMNSGLIIVYFAYENKSIPLPYTTYAGSKPNTISYIPMLDKIAITRFTHNNSNHINLSTLLQYRYILIPGSVPRAKLAAIDYSDYTAVCRYYGIPE